ncbi:MAG: protoporphyrinogen oxidase [Angustibacter sp.]
MGQDQLDARRRPTVAVVGGGIAGLAAAWRLSRATTRSAGDAVTAVRVVLVDAAEQVGGKLATVEVGGLSVDAGAEAMVARRPEGVDLARQVGLGENLTVPVSRSASVVVRGARHPLPAGTLMGVPSTPAGLDGLLDASQIAVIAAEPERSWPRLGRPVADEAVNERAGVGSDVDPGADADVDVGSFVSSRLGRGVVDRLVEPLLGGVYAGRAAQLSVRATVPGLWPAARDGSSVVRAAAAAVRAGADTRGPVFAGITGGLGRLPLAVAARLRESGCQVWTGWPARSLQRAGQRWRLRGGPLADEQVLEVDAVVLAVPAPVASRLLGGVGEPAAKGAAADLATVEYADVAVTTLIFGAGAAGVDGSGLLVPPARGGLVKGVTFSSAKWAWVAQEAGGRVVIRASVGRHGDARNLDRDDPDLIAAVLGDLRGLPGLRLPDPVAAVVTRWRGGLPQYTVGHLARVDRVRRAVARLPGVAVAGAGYDGVGVPACIESGWSAAATVLDHLRQPASAAARLEP